MLGYWDWRSNILLVLMNGRKIVANIAIEFHPNAKTAFLKLKIDEFKFEVLEKATDFCKFKQLFDKIIERLFL
jgi:hypothetical protein